VLRIWPLHVRQKVVFLRLAVSEGYLDINEKLSACADSEPVIAPILLASNFSGSARPNAAWATKDRQFGSSQAPGVAVETVAGGP